MKAFLLMVVLIGTSLMYAQSGCIPSFSSTSQDAHFSHADVAHNNESYRHYSFDTSLDVGPFAGYSPCSIKHFSDEFVAYHLLLYAGSSLRSDDTIATAFSRLSKAQQKKLLGLHEYYRMPRFLACIKFLPKYESYIKKLYALQDKSTLLGRGWNKLVGKVPPNLDVLHQELLSRKLTAHAKTSVLHESLVSATSYEIEDVLVVIQENHEYYYENEAWVDTHHNDRIQALDQAIHSHRATSFQVFNLSADSKQFLDNYSIADDLFLQCTGDAYQQQLHQEVVAVIDSAALLHKKHYDDAIIRDITHSIGECAYVGSAYNHEKKVVEATKIINFCHSLLEFGQALADGMYDGISVAVNDGWQDIKNSAYIVFDACQHPMQAVSTLCNKAAAVPAHITHVARYGALLLERVADQFYEVIYDVGDLTITYFQNPELGREIIASGLQDMQEDVAYAAMRIQEITVHSAKVLLPVICTPENIHIGAAFIAEHGLKCATSHLVGKAYGRIASHALAYATTVAKNAGIGAAKGGKACFDLASNVSQRMACFASQAGTTIGASKYAKVTSKFFTAKGQEIAELVSWSKKVMQPIADVMTATGLQKFTASEKFLHHIFSAEMKEYIKHSGAIKKKLSGFHHFFPEHLEAQGIQLLNNKVCEKTGIIIADVLCDGHTETRKTFFPTAWNRKKVLEKIYESLQFLTEAPLQERGDWVLYGKTTEDLKIKTVISNLGELVTSFPYQN